MRIKNVVDGHGDYHGLVFKCPGCGLRHTVTNNLTPPGYALSRYLVGKETWTFNGNYDLPTLGPSVLVRRGHYIDGNDKQCYCNFEARTGQKTHYTCGICHSFVEDGEIKFLTDSTHQLAGKKVPLPEFTEVEPKPDQDCDFHDDLD